MLRKIRITLAVICFALITLLLLDFTGTLHTWFGWLARIQFLPAVLALNVAVVASLVVLTLLLGRVYCSVICPLGVFQDIVSWLSSRRRKYRYRFSYSPAKRWLRIAVLVLFVAAIARASVRWSPCWHPTAPTGGSPQTSSPRSTAGATTCWPTSPSGPTATPSTRPTCG